MTFSSSFAAALYQLLPRHGGWRVKADTPWATTWQGRRTMTGGAASWRTIRHSAATPRLLFEQNLLEQQP